VHGYHGLKKAFVPTRPESSGWDESLFDSEFEAVTRCAATASVVCWPSGAGDGRTPPSPYLHRA
jgi:hypothetical protein